MDKLTEIEATTAPFNWVAAAAKSSPLTVSIEAETFLHVWNSFSRPAEFICSDGKRYVLKSLRNDGNDISRPIFNDQTVARLGALIDAPVGQVALVYLGKSLIDLNSEIAHMEEGVAHATLRINDVSERVDAISHVDEPENLTRYAALSVLYGWIGTIDDRQFLFGTKTPCLVYSVDHGHFFPGGPNWTIGNLTAPMSAAQPDQGLIASARVNYDDLTLAYDKLATVAETEILGAVMASPQPWLADVEDRVALAEFLWRRRNELLANRLT